MQKPQRHKGDFITFSIGDMQGEVTGGNIRPTLDLLTKKLHDEKRSYEPEISEEEVIRFSDDYVPGEYVSAFKQDFDIFKEDVDKGIFPFTVNLHTSLISDFEPIKNEILGYFRYGFKEIEHCFSISNIAVELYEFLIYHTPRDSEGYEELELRKSTREIYIFYKTSQEFCRALIFIEDGDYSRARFILNELSLELSDYINKKQESFASKITKAEKEFCRSEEIPIEEYFLETDEIAQSMNSILYGLIMPELRNTAHLSEKPPKNVKVNNTPYEDLEVEFRESLSKEKLIRLRSENESNKNKLIRTLEQKLAEIRSHPDYQPFFFDKCRYDE